MTTHYPHYIFFAVLNDGLESNSFRLYLVSFARMTPVALVGALCWEENWLKL